MALDAAQLASVVAAARPAPPKFRLLCLPPGAILVATGRRAGLRCQGRVSGGAQRPLPLTA